MPEDSLLRRLKRAAEEPFSGWDFSRLRGRMVEEPVSWSYEEIVRAHLPAARSLLDMDTGGGELLIREFQPLPLQTTATEGYPPNVSIARARLAPFGVHVVAPKGSSNLPFPDESFDLVINRHGAYRPDEISRLLRPGGFFITQQVEADNLADLNERFGVSGVPLQWPSWRLQHAREQLQLAGLSITRAEEAVLATHFADIEAIVYFLKAVPWQISGFTVEAYLPQLESIDREISSTGPLQVHAHRFLLTARKATSDSGSFTNGEG